MLDQVADLIREVAAAEVLPRFRHLTSDEIVQKSPGDLVTVADKESEKALTRGLTSLLPGSVVVGEEAVAADASVLKRMSDAGAVWVVDPVDGTNNFAAGKTPFAVMVALMQDGEAVASWILDPVTDQLTVAEAGSGAYRDGVRLKTRTDDPGVGALQGAVAGKYLPEDLRSTAAAHAGAFARIHPGHHCAGYEYPSIATDEQQFAVFWLVLPWDHVPGTLIIRESGGAVAHLDGSRYVPSESTERGLLVAANEDIWRTVRDELFPDL